MKLIRNFLGVVIVTVGAFIFQIGFAFMTKDMQDDFAKRFVKGLVGDR